MTSELDAKGPHVHLDERNPERDNPGTQAAPLPGNVPSGLAERLLRLAQQYEDQHAPQNITMALREAANRLSNLRTETLEYLGQVGQLSDELKRVRDVTLEEAAVECERMEKVFAPQQVITDRCAAAIRALRGKP